MFTLKDHHRVLYLYRLEMVRLFDLDLRDIRCYSLHHATHVSVTVNRVKDTWGFAVPRGIEIPVLTRLRSMPARSSLADVRAVIEEEYACHTL